MDWTIVIGPLAAILTILVDRWLQRKKTKAETDQISAESVQLNAKTRIEIDKFWEERSQKVQLEYCELETKHLQLRADHERLRADLDQTKAQVLGLIGEMSFVKRVVAKMWAGINVLLKQLCDAGLAPAWTPDEEVSRYCVALLNGVNDEATALKSFDPPVQSMRR